MRVPQAQARLIQQIGQLRHRPAHGAHGLRHRARPQAAVAAGCELHLLRSGARLPERGRTAGPRPQTPGITVHRNLDDFSEFVLERAHVPHSSPMDLR
jgi:hypothetical protein